MCLLALKETYTQMHMFLANNALEKTDHDNIYPRTLFAKNWSKTPNCCNFLVCRIKSRICIFRVMNQDGNFSQISIS